MATTTHPSIPTFQNSLLVELGGLVGKRAKTLKHNTFNYCCNRGFDNGFERLSIRFEVHNRASFRINVWEDGTLWLGINKPAKRGWEFEYQARGCVRTEFTDDFVPVIEESRLMIGKGDFEKLPDDLTNMWSKFDLAES